jgi:hypothetical protein
MANILEFCQFSKYYVDYFSVFALPSQEPPPAPLQPPPPGSSPPPMLSALSSCCRCTCCWRTATSQEQDAELRPLELQQHSEDLEMNVQQTVAIGIAPPSSSASQGRALTPRHSKSSTDSSLSTISVANNNNSSSNNSISVAAPLPASGSGGPQSMMTPTSIQLLSNIGQRPSSQLDAHFNPTNSGSTSNNPHSSGGSGSGSASAAMYGPSLLLRSSSRPPFNHSHMDMEIVQSKPRSDSTDSSETTTLGEKEFL